MAMCYPDSTDWTCVGTPEEIAALDPVKVARAEALAWGSIARLSGFRVSTCPVVLRPCRARCAPESSVTAPVEAWGGPYISGGRWYNACGCRRDECGCGIIRELVLPDTEVSGPIVVTIDGAVLDPTSYRIDNGNRLVRMDGQDWPMCQDMNLPDGEDGTFSISYYVGVGPDDLLNYAAGLLAGEWYKACDGRDCKIPDTATRVVRQGISFEIPSFDSGTSGMREVDNIIAMYNPFHLKVPSRVVSVDSIRGRKRTA